MKKATSAIGGLLLLLAGSPAWAELEIIALKHRSVDHVIPVLQPLIEQGGTLSGVNGQLVIRAGRANIAELRKVLASIDIAPRRLMITVRQDLGGGSGEPGATGKDPRRAATARVYDSRSANESRLEQRIQAIEGTPALLQIGQSVPVTNRTLTQGPGGAVVTDSVAYRDVTTGFEVVPRVAGDRVILDIRPRRDTPAADRAINLQRMASTASARLGEWFELGGAAQDESRGLVAGTNAIRQDVRRVWVKVEELGDPAAKK
jgi:type II secretory pathway component GspD/PulD (secretin)